MLRLKIKKLTKNYKKYFINCCFRPQDFNGLLSKNAHRVNWRKIVGNDSSFDWAATQEEEDTDEEQEKEATKSGGEPSTGTATTSAAKSVVLEPVAGPWASVSKHLQLVLIFYYLKILLGNLRKENF